jgi:GxxExxY protein
MPVIIRTPIRRLSQAEFGEIAYSVMQCIFQIHGEMGRFFDEKIYKRELAHRHPGVQLEVPIEVVHATFRKLQYLDVLVAGGAPFEFKAVEAFAPRHSAQLLHYMFLAELDHGKLINLRNESVEHQFINTTIRREERTGFAVNDSRWSDKPAGAVPFREALTALLRDWGTGLDLQLYEEAVVHLLGDGAQLLADVEVRTPEHALGHQKMRLAAPRVAFVLTALPEAGVEYESHARRFLRHTEIKAILWANISLKTVTFTTIT